MPPPPSLQKPRLIVNADDYGFTPGVSRGIRELLATRRVSATSVMAASEFWPEEAAALKAVAGDADIGLHLTLTDQAPLGAMPSFAPSGRFPPLKPMMRAALLRQLPLAEIEAEVERQLARFMQHYGPAPSHIDGHHHVHQLPGVRQIVLRHAARLGVRYVRSCASPAALILQRGIAPAKAMTIGVFSAGLKRQAAALDLATNSSFSGVYDFAAPGAPIDALFRLFLTSAGENALLMCHPGFSDAVLAARDHVTTARDAEQAFLASAAWPEMIASAGLDLGPFRRADPGTAAI
jgi:chitin disaccharide deacetylase